MIKYTADRKNPKQAIENWFAAVEASEFASDLKCISYIGDSYKVGFTDIKNKHNRSKYYKNFYHFMALGGLLSKQVKQAHANGNLYAWNGNFALPWFKKELGLEYADLNQDLLLDNPQNKVVLYFVSGSIPRSVQERMNAFKMAGVTFLTMNDVYSQVIGEAEVSREDVEAYLEALRAKVIAPKTYEIPVLGRETLVVKYNEEEDNYEFVQGTQSLALRKFFAVNGSIVDRKAILVAVINYLVTVYSRDDFKGRLAYLSDVFVDQIHVGYSHKFIEKFVTHKLGNLMVVVGRNLQPIIKKSSNIIAAAKAYEAAGHSVFMHKGAKYLVIDADCGFFTRIGDTTHVAWQSDKRAKITGRMLSAVATAAEIDSTKAEAFEPKLAENKVYSRGLDGELYSYSGVEYQEAAVASPLVEEGSGQGLGHPEVSRNLVTKTKVKATLPIYTTKEDEILEQVEIAPVGTRLQFGDPVILQKSPMGIDGTIVVASWDHLITGMVVGEPVIAANGKTNTVEFAVDCVHVMSGDAEKFRGFCKFRSNGGFLKNINITSNQGELIFDPKQPLYNAAGELAQCEHVLGGEEYKTLMFVISLLADKMPEGKAVWSAATGEWEHDEVLQKLIESEMKLVTVTRSNIEQVAYDMLKTQYQDNPDFVFDDSQNKVTHNNAYCWVGTHANIVEVPMTGIFIGKTRLFSVALTYIGTEYPELYNQLLDTVDANVTYVGKALDVARGYIEGATKENSSGNYLLLDHKSVVTRGTTDLDFEDYGEGYVKVCNKIVAESFDWEFLQALVKLLKANNYPGFAIEVAADNGETFLVVVPLEIILGFTGVVSHKVIRNLFQVLLHLQIDLADRDHNKWAAKFYRFARLLESSLEETVVNSNALVARASKTADVAFTCRAGTTIDASVGLAELHLHPDLMKFWGLRAGDTAVIGRVPVPGVGNLQIVPNVDVPFGTGVLNAFTKHAIEEGDSDGDSMVFLALDKQGKLRKPHRNMPTVSLPISE